MEEFMSVSKVSLVELTPKNYRKWITEIKGHAEAAEVRQYANPDTETTVPATQSYPDISDYNVSHTANNETTLIPATRFEQLSDDQRQSYKFELETFKHKEREATRIKGEVRKIRNMVLESARTHIPDTKFSATGRELIKSLQTRFKRDDDTLIEAIHDKYEDLKDKPPSRDKLEHWIAQWENLRDEMISQGVEGSFSEKRMATDFLKAGSNYAPTFCTNWASQKKAAEEPLHFMETTAAYREAVDKEKKASCNRNRGNAYANASFQGQSVGQSQPQPQPQEAKSEGGKKKKKNLEYLRNRFKERKCVCGVVHVFPDCGYLLKESRSTGWKEDPKVRNEVRQRILQSYGFFLSIKKFSDIGILDGITEDSFSEEAKQQRPRNQGNQDNQETQQSQTPQTGSTHRFSAAFFTANGLSKMGSSNPLYYSVIYESGCSQTCTWDKSRFVGEITPFDGWTSTPEGTGRIPCPVDSSPRSVHPFSYRNH